MVLALVPGYAGVPKTWAVIKKLWIVIIGRKNIVNWEMEFSGWGTSRSWSGFGVLGCFWVLAYRFPVRFSVCRKLCNPWRFFFSSPRTQAKFTSKTAEIVIITEITEIIASNVPNR